jgi:hypothetical protein
MPGKATSCDIVEHLHQGRIVRPRTIDEITEMNKDEAAAALADFENTQRTIIVLTNHPGVPGPRIRAHQVAEILFSD